GWGGGAASAVVCGPRAAEAGAVGGDQAAPDTVLAYVPVPQRQLQALGAHRAPGADGDRRGGLASGPGCVDADREPFVGAKAAVSAPGVPGDPGPQGIIGQRRGGKAAGDGRAAPRAACRARPAPPPPP